MNLRKCLDIVRGMIHIDLNHDIKNTVLLAGVPRGGTTWISEIINHRNKYRYMFEPFYNENVGLFEEFDSNEYIRPGEMNQRVFLNIHKVLSGRITHPWICRFNRKVLCDKRLIKEVRVNLFLKWLKDSFPDLRIILLLRHPFAVACSRIRLGWDVNLRSFWKQTSLVSDHLEPFMPEIKRCSKDFEKHVCAWCIQNYVPLTQFKGTGDLYVAFYERFCIDVLRESRAMLRYLGDDTYLDPEANLCRPSRMTYSQSAIARGEDLIRWWTNRITESELKRGIEILSIFGIDKIYSEKAVPNENYSYS